MRPNGTKREKEQSEHGQQLVQAGMMGDSDPHTDGHLCPGCLTAVSQALFRVEL